MADFGRIPSHEKHAAAMSSLQGFIKEIAVEKARVAEERRIVRDNRKFMDAKLIPGLFSGFKSLQKFFQTRH